nr:hypothetical protein [Tanacetum cinerariifolium]
MHKAFLLLEESSHWQYNFPLPVEGVPTARRMEIPLLKSLHCYDEETASQRELAVTLRRWLMKMVQKETTRSQNHAYVSPSHRSAGQRSYGAPMRPSHRPAGHRPHGPPMRPMISNMNGARPKRTSAVRPQYRAPWVPTINRNFPPLIENFPLVTQIFSLFVAAAQDMLILLDQWQ